MNNSNCVKNIVIVGGGTAGWMTAAAFANRLPTSHSQISLIESDSIGTVGVGESTIPHIRQFNEILGISENEFIQQTKATFKLGIRFRNWGKPGDDYIHPFGEVGSILNGIEFHHYWARAKQLGLDSDFEQFSILALAARQGKFSDPNILKQTKFSDYAYSYHIDASAYAKFLRQYAEKRGVKRIEGKITQAIQNDNGDIKSVVLENGRQIEADLFIDCSGFSGLLIDKTLGSSFESWQHWLPTNKAVVVQTSLTGSYYPMTTATAHSAGWQWHIPIQNRSGNGHVYCDRFMSDDEAKDILLNNIEGQLLTEPRLLKFEAGVRPKSWLNNCVAIGLSSGFLEPLESTSIYLIQHAIFKLLEYFPRLENMEYERNQYNSEMKSVYETIRDFIILHYCVNTRQNSEFWTRQREMKLPESLTNKMALFAESGRVKPGQFGVWPAVCIGQGLIPEYPDSRLAQLSKNELAKILNQQSQIVLDSLKQLPDAQTYLNQYLAIQQMEGAIG